MALTEPKAIVLSTGNDFLVPAAELSQVLATYQWKKQFIESVLVEGIDYGATPGTNEKPSLKKPGAEKMASFFGLAPVFEDVETVEDWTGANHNNEPFFYYRQKCKLYRGDRLIATADGSCNSWEKKYRYRWVSEYEIPASIDRATLKTKGGRTSEFVFAIDKAETSGKYGKPAEYWRGWNDAIANGNAKPIKRKTSSGKEMDAWEMDSTVYAIVNSDAAEQVNTILKMSQKRALVAAVLIATNASDYFTQDLEDMGDFTDREIIQGTVKPVHAPTPTPQPENINQETGEVTEAVELIDPMGQWAVEYAAKFWNVKTGEAAVSIASKKLGKQIDKRDFIQIVTGQTA